MSIRLTPEDALTFRRPLTRTAFNTLTVRNDYDTPIAFKIQSTAPLRYIVKPNVGILSEKSSIQVQFMLLPFAHEPTDDSHTKDKFLLETVQLTQQKHLAPLMNELWAKINNDPQFNIERHRIHCNFDPDDDLVPMANQEMERTKSELMSLEERINGYEDELGEMRALVEARRKRTLSLQVILAVAVAVFSLSYTFFAVVNNH